MDRIRKFNIAVTGTSTFNDYVLMEQKLDKILTDRHPNIRILSGKRLGAEELGKQYALSRGYDMKWFWRYMGSSAKEHVIKTNQEMLVASDAIIVFWDGVSPGVKHLIDTAKNMRRPLRVISY